MSKIKVYINGKRKFSWFGLVWKYDRVEASVIFRKPPKDENSISVVYPEERF